MSTRPRRGQAVHELVGTSVWGFRKDLRGWHSGVVIDVQWWGSTGDALTGQFEPRLEFSDRKKQWCPRWSSTEVLLLPPPALTSPPAPTLPPVLSSSVVLQLSPPALSSLPALSLLPHESDAEADSSDDDADDGMFGSEDVSKAGEVGALAAAAKAAKKAASTALPSSLTLPPPPSPISWMPFPVIIDPALLGGSEPSWSVGQAVSARFMASALGKDTRWFPGKISAVHGNEASTFALNIMYNDGDYEENVLPKYVKAMPQQMQAPVVQNDVQGMETQVPAELQAPEHTPAHADQPNCGVCVNCKDMPKFGGPNKIRQRCVLRAKTQRLSTTLPVRDAFQRPHKAPQPFLPDAFLPRSGPHKKQAGLTEKVEEAEEVEVEVVVEEESDDEPRKTRRQFSEHEDDAILRARANGVRWADIGRDLGRCSASISHRYLLLMSRKQGRAAPIMTDPLSVQQQQPTAPGTISERLHALEVLVYGQVCSTEALTARLTKLEADWSEDASSSTTPGASIPQRLQRLEQIVKAAGF